MGQKVQNIHPPVINIHLLVINIQKNEQKKEDYHIIRYLKQNKKVSSENERD